MYAVLDDQSNRSLAKSDFFDLFNISGTPSTYTLKTCAGIKQTTGRKANNSVVVSLDRKIYVPLPPLLEYNMMPDDRSKIPTPNNVQYFPHLSPVEGKIPPIEPNSPPHFNSSLTGKRHSKCTQSTRAVQWSTQINTPYSPQLYLGWVIIGEVCLGRVHEPMKVNIFRTNVLQNSHTSFFEPCTRVIQVKENLSTPVQCHINNTFSDIEVASLKSTNGLGLTVFQRYPDDDKLALSIEDKNIS